jgi:hypothetical protein
VLSRLVRLLARRVARPRAGVGVARRARVSGYQEECSSVPKKKCKKKPTKQHAMNSELRPDLPLPAELEAKLRDIINKGSMEERYMSPKGKLVNVHDMVMEALYAYGWKHIRPELTHMKHWSGKVIDLEDGFELKDLSTQLNHFLYTRIVQDYHEKRKNAGIQKAQMTKTNNALNRVREEMARRALEERKRRSRSRSPSRSRSRSR